MSDKRIRVVDRAAKCPFCGIGISDKTRKARDNCIIWSTDQNVAEFKCGTTWFMPDEKGRELFFRKCGEPHEQTVYGPKKRETEPPVLDIS
jgi:hypothetical protein